ncbi:hypothetical protein JNM05_12005 [bacterium]|nr:hypothetical protein [bacterium]
MERQDQKNSDSTHEPSQGEGPLPNETSEIHFIDIILLLVPWKKRILLVTLGVMILTAGITFVMDKWYESTAVILLPEKSASALESLGSTLGGLSQSLLGVSGVTGPQRFIAILKSRRLKEAVINEYDLIQAFDLEQTREDTLALIELLDETILSESNNKNATITITVRFKEDAVKTAEMTNFVVSKLDEINRELSTEQAKSSRLFIEKRYDEARTDLKEAEDQLNKFQNVHGIIALPEQTKASIEAAAEIQAEVTTTETEYNVLKKTLGENHPELLRLQSKIQELSKIQKKMEFGGLDLSVLIPFKDAPNLALEYFRLYREVQINQKIVEFLVPQFEQAKIQEAKDTPTLLVLDKGKPAAFQYKPKKKIIVTLAGILTFVALCGVIAGFEIIKGHPTMEDKRVRTILNSLKPRNFFR